MRLKRLFERSIPALAAVAALSAANGALAQSADNLADSPALQSALESASQINPLAVTAIGAFAIALAAIFWALRASQANRSQAVDWSRRLAEMEARLEKADSVLSAHPGLVLVWEDDNDTIADGWGEPKILGGPAALASLLSFSADASDPSVTPVDRLLNTLGDLPLNDDAAEKPASLKEKIDELRTHGIAFSSTVVAEDGRAIEIDGRVAGGQVALWLTDPAVRMAEDGAIISAFRQNAADLHSSHSLLDRAPFPAWRRNAECQLVWVNRTYVDAVEADSAAEVVKQQIELDGAAKKLAGIAAAARKPADERVIVNLRGDRRVMTFIETPLHGSGDAGLGGFALDITELDKAKADLRQHIEANQRTLDQIETAVAIFGASQNLIYHNRAFQKLWDIDDAALSGRVYHGEILDNLRFDGKLPEQADYDDWKAAQLALYMSELSAPGSERDGGAPDEIWHLPDGRALRVTKQRHPLGGVMMAFDNITEKISLEAKFNTQISVQKATLNNLAEGVAVFGGDGALRLYNKAFEKLWRFDGQMLSRTPHIDVVAAHLAGKIDSGGEPIGAVRRAVTSKSPDDRKPIISAEISLRDGRTIAIGTEPLPDGATLAHFLDVTDSKEREKALKERNAILENADRLKSKFVDHVSYQLRTPLSTIIGFSEMLDGQMFGILNDRQKDYVASVLSASYHLRDLINDIIDLAAIDAGKIEIDRNDADIRALLEHAATFSALKAEDTQVSLKVECPKEIGSVSLDERRIKQVLFNLLSNAFAYTGAGGVVTLGAARTSGVVKIWVEDTGRGISPADQAKIFDAFESRGPNAGAGLGLSLVEKFVRLHGGWVRMDSNEGAGSRISIYLPEVQNAQASEREDGDKIAHKDAKSQPKTGARKTSRKRARKARAGANSPPQAAE